MASICKEVGDHLVEIDGRMANIAYKIHNTIIVRYAFR